MVSDPTKTQERTATPTRTNGNRRQDGRSLKDARPVLALSQERIEPVSGWGKSAASTSHVYRPATIEGLRGLFRLARRSGLTVGFRGTGNSYGDAAQNGENILVSLSRINRNLV
jgi:FAD/FMN-containing dehydrogenase